MDQLAIVIVGGTITYNYVFSEFKLLTYLRKILMILNQPQGEGRKAVTEGGYIHVNQKLR
jgi:hypothetical protein